MDTQDNDWERMSKTDKRSILTFARDLKFEAGKKMPLPLLSTNAYPPSNGL